MKTLHDYQDGEIIEDSLVMSRKGGYCVVVYRCSCEREQTARNSLTSNGIGEDAAKSVGWTKTDIGWLCPFCSGRSSWLDKVFNSSINPK